MLGAHDEHGKPVRKSTVFYSNRRWHGILKRCGGHKGQGHGILQGKWAGLDRTTMAAVYPRRLCQQFCQDLMYMLKKVDRAATHPWPRQLWWASGFFYSCERCQLGARHLPVVNILLFLVNVATGSPACAMSAVRQELQRLDLPRGI